MSMSMYISKKVSKCLDIGEKERGVGKGNNLDLVSFHFIDPKPSQTQPNPIQPNPEA